MAWLAHWLVFQLFAHFRLSDAFALTGVVNAPGGLGLFAILFLGSAPLLDMRHLGYFTKVVVRLVGYIALAGTLSLLPLLLLVRFDIGVQLNPHRLALAITLV